MAEYSIFTSESVSEGHPDKMADQISDAVVDAMLEQDRESRVACETLIKSGIVVVAGEVRSRAEVNLDVLVRQVIRDIGYTSAEVGMDPETCAVVNALGQQSPDIAQGVDRQAGMLGAGPPFDLHRGDLSGVQVVFEVQRRA